MTEIEMLNSLMTVFDNMTADKDRGAYSQMLSLLDDMRYYLLYDLQIEYPHREIEVQQGEFSF